MIYLDFIQYQVSSTSWSTWNLFNIKYQINFDLHDISHNLNSPCVIWLHQHIFQTYYQNIKTQHIIPWSNRTKLGSNCTNNLPHMLWDMITPTHIKYKSKTYHKSFAQTSKSKIELDHLGYDYINRLDHQSSKSNIHFCIVNQIDM